MLLTFLIYYTNPAKEAYAMFGNFTTTVKDSSFSDEQVETFFYQLDPSDHVAALDLLKQHRLGLAKQIAREILDAAVNLCAHCTECGQNSVDFIQMACLHCGKKYADSERDTMFDKDGMPV